MIIDKAIKILVAEDDYLVSEEILRELKVLGYKNFIEADNGIEAVDKTCSLHPDVILIDIKMPELDGLEASRQIQERCPTPIIILTAYESHDFLKKATEVGVAAYLTKPPKSDELERTIIIAMARHADFMELRRLNKELEQALSEIKQLKGILPICSYCKKIRDDKGYWEQLEAYITKHSEALFSHGMCPACAEKAMKEVEDFKNENT